MEPFNTPIAEVREIGIDQKISITNRDIKEINQKIKDKSKELKERLGLNATMANVEEEYKSVSKLKTNTKRQVISNDETMKQLDKELKDLRGNKKELVNLLSDCLIEFEGKTGQLSFLDDEGQVIEFEKVAKIRSNM